MKRDLDLVRALLLRVEAADGSLCETDFEFKNYSSKQVDYHLELLIEKGFLDGKVSRDWGRTIVNVQIHGVTWDGQDYLDTIRDDDLWKKIKKAIKAVTDTTTFEVTKQVATQVAIKQILSQM